MNDQVTLVNLDDFQLHYEHIADFDNGASPTGDVIINLIDAANHAIQAGMNACDLILASEQCAKPEAISKARALVSTFQVAHLVL